MVQQLFPSALKPRTQTPLPRFVARIAYNLCEPKTGLITANQPFPDQLPDFPSFGRMLYRNFLLRMGYWPAQTRWFLDRLLIATSRVYHSAVSNELGRRA